MDNKGCSEKQWGFFFQVDSLYWMGDLFFFSERPLKLFAEAFKISPRDGGKCYGMGFHWCKPLEEGYKYTFTFYFLHLPDLIVIGKDIIWQEGKDEFTQDGIEKVWDIRVGSPGKKVTISYIPKKVYSNIIWFVRNKGSNPISSLPGCDMATAFCYRSEIDIEKPSSYPQWEVPYPTVRSPRYFSSLEVFRSTPSKKKYSLLSKTPYPTEDIEIIDYIPGIAGAAPFLRGGSFEKVILNPQYYKLLSTNGVKGIRFSPSRLNQVLHDSSVGDAVRRNIRTFVTEVSSVGNWTTRKYIGLRSDLEDTIELANSITDEFPRARFFFYLAELSLQQWGAFISDKYANFRSPLSFRRVEEHFFTRKDWRTENGWNNKNRFEQIKKICQLNLRWKGNIWKRLNHPERVFLLCGTDEAAYPTAYFYKSGADIVATKQIHRQNVEIIVANARGAARAYKEKFGLEFDAWVGNLRWTYHPDEYEQIFYLFFFSGANVICHESSFFVEEKDKVYPNKLGDRFLKVSQFTQIYPRRGDPVVKIAICRGFGDMWTLVSSEATAGGWSRYWGEEEEKLDYNLLDIFFPDYGLYWRTNLDRLCTGTPYGPIDMIPWDTPLAHLKSYELVIYMGINAMDEAQFQNIQNYVESGGRVIISLGQFCIEGDEPRRLINKNLSQLLGIEPVVDKRRVPVLVKKEEGVSFIIDGKERAGLVRQYFKISPLDCEIIAKTVMNDDPIVTRKIFGKGEIFLYATDFMSRISENINREFLSSLAKKAKFLNLYPESNWIEYSVFKKKSTYIFIFFNHGRIKFPSGNGKDQGIWKGKIEIDTALLGSISTKNLEGFVFDFSKLEPRSITVKTNQGKISLKLRINNRVGLIIGEKGKAIKDFFS